MMDRNTPNEMNAQKINQPPRDPQQTYDDGLLEYTDGKGAEANDDRTSHEFKGRFPRDFFKYSQDYHDRDFGAPGIDQDFGTQHSIRGQEVTLPNAMPEGDGVFETSEDRRIREEVMDALTRDLGLDAKDITVRVADGVVTLSGTVDEARIKRDVEDSVQSVPGADDVIDCLIVNPRAE